MTKPWEEPEDKNGQQSLAKTIKRAKRVSLIRNMVISAVAAVVAVVLVQFVALQLTYRASDKAYHRAQLNMSLTSPNEYEGGYADMRGFLSGTIELRSYKLVEGVPVPWGERWFSYKVPGILSVAGRGGSVGSGTISVEDEDMKAAGFEYMRGYNAFNGQRELSFYVPGVDYNDKILNELDVVSGLSDEKVAELAISFDREYSLKEVKAMLPQELTQAWYWIDTYDNRTTFQFNPWQDERGGISYPTPMSKAFNVYGFRSNGLLEEGEAANFLRELEYGIQLGGRYEEDYQRVYNYIKGDKDSPQADDVRILGVVVTGSAEELLSLQGQPYVRAAVLGAVADRY